MKTLRIESWPIQETGLEEAWLFLPQPRQSACGYTALAGCRHYFSGSG